MSVHLLTTIDVILHPVFDIVALILLIAASLYVLCVRKKHMEEIRKRQRYFGLQEEEFNILKSMAVSIRGMIKLNIVTALLVITGALCRLLSLFCVPGIHELWFRVPGFLFVISNPFVYICVMKELRHNYLRLLKCKRRRQTRPEPTTTNTCNICAPGRQVVAPGGGIESKAVRSEGGTVQVGLRCVCGNKIPLPNVKFEQGTTTKQVSYQ